jgi:hypothetical protein
VSARTIPWDQYQKLPAEQRSRPLTDEEYSQLSPSQLEAGGLAEPSETAPADFGGRVLPNPTHIRPHDDSESTIPITRLPQGVSFNRENWSGTPQMDVSNPLPAEIQPEMGREVGAKMSAAAPAMPWEKYAKAPAAAPAAGQGSAEPGPWAKYAPKTDTAEKKEEPGFLDKEIPLSGPWYNPTLSGVQSVGRGIRSAVRGIGETLDPRTHGADEEAIVGTDPRARLALPAYRTLRGIGQTAKDATQIPAAIHDINASPDPLSHYGKALQDTSGDLAGQALTAAATEGAGRAIGAGAEAARTPGAAVNRIARTAGKTAADVAEDIPGVRALGKVKKNWEATAPKLPAEVTQARGLQTGGQPAVEPSTALGRIATPKATPEAIPRELPKELDATTENKPFAGGLDEPKPRIAKPLDATSENKPFAGGLDEYTGPAKAKPAQDIPSPSQTAQARVYRSRSIGEEGIPYRPAGHAQATASQAEAESMMPGREDIEGQPQELISTDLSQAPGFSARPGPNGPNWFKFHGEVPESAVTRIARPGEVTARPIAAEPSEAPPTAAPATAAPAGTADPLLNRLREHAASIQEQGAPQVPGENEDLTDLLTRSLAQARAARGARSLPQPE